MPFGSFQRYMTNGTQNGKSLAETRVRVRATRDRLAIHGATAEVSGFAQPACPVRCKLAALGEIRPERVMSQADDFRQYAGRPIDGPIDSNKTAHRPRAPRTADGKAAAFQDSSKTMGPALRPAKRTCAREPQGCIISQLNRCVLGTIYLNMFCRIDYLPCAPAPV